MKAPFSRNTGILLMAPLLLLLAATAATAAAVAQITGYRAAGMTGQGPGPTEIAERFD